MANGGEKGPLQDPSFGLENLIPSYAPYQAMLAPLVPDIMPPAQREEWKLRTGFQPMVPPLLESPAEKAAREAREQEAMQVIDKPLGPKERSQLAKYAVTPSQEDILLGRGAQAAPAKVGPARWAPTSRITKETVERRDLPLMKGAIKEGKKLAEEKIEAGELAQKVEDVEGAKRAVEYRQHWENLAGDIHYANRIREQQQKIFNEDRKEIQRLQQEEQDMGLDPERYWKKKGTFLSIIAKIGMALGAGAAALTKGPNFAQQIVEAGIRRDMESQKADLAKKTRQIAGRRAGSRAAITEGKALMDNLRQGILMKGRGLEMRIQAIADQYKGTKAYAQWMDAKANVRQAYLNFYMKEMIGAAGKRTVQRATQEKRFRPGAGAGRRGLKIDPVQARRAADTVTQIDNGIKDVSDIMGLAKQTDFPGVEKYWPNSKAQRLSHRLRAITMRVRKAMGDVGQITAKDEQMFDYIKQGAFQSKRELLLRANWLKGWMYRGIDSTVKAAKAASLMQAGRADPWMEYWTRRSRMGERSAMQREKALTGAQPVRGPGEEE